MAKKIRFRVKEVFQRVQVTVWTFFHKKEVQETFADVIERRVASGECKCITLEELNAR